MKNEKRIMNSYGGSALLNIKPSQSALLTALPKGEPFHAAIGCHRNYSFFIIHSSLLNNPEGSFFR